MWPSPSAAVAWLLRAVCSLPSAPSQPRFLSSSSLLLLSLLLSLLPQRRCCPRPQQRRRLCSRPFVAAARCLRTHRTPRTHARQAPRTLLPASTSLTHRCRSQHSQHSHAQATSGVATAASQISPKTKNEEEKKKKKGISNLLDENVQSAGAKHRPTSAGSNTQTNSKRRVSSLCLSSGGLLPP